MTATNSNTATMTDDDRAEYRHGYRTAIIWANAYISRPDDGEMLPAATSGAEDWADANLSAAVRAELDAEADDFLTNPAVMDAIWGAMADDPAYNWGDVGHDFALTQNGHGAGFWDGRLDYGRGEILTAAANSHGPVSLIGADADHPESWFIIN